MAVISTTIGGHGAMQARASASTAPWGDLRGHVEMLGLLRALAGTQGVKDIVVNQQARMRVRVKGDYLSVVPGEAVTTGTWWRNLCSAIDPQTVELADTVYCHEGACVLGDQRFRFSRVKTDAGEELTLRVLPRRIPSPSEILLPQNLVHRFCEIKDGIIFFAGVTGSGKSTSIASLIAEDARRIPKRVVLVEDPIEYQQEDLPNGSTFTAREIGRHAPDFASALKDAMRMNPDTIVVGEIRDAASADVALAAAATGHKVVSTIHGGSIEQAMQRFVDLAADLGESAVGAFAQVFRMGVVQRLEPIGRGGSMLSLQEILTVNQSVQTKLRQSKIFALRQEMEAGREEGMQTFEQAVINRREAGLLGSGFGM